MLFLNCAVLLLCKKVYKINNLIQENCDLLKKSIDSASDGVFGIFPFNDVTKRVDVWCDMTSSSHGWTVS